jgi:hypothetical protein
VVHTSWPKRSAEGFDSFLLGQAKRVRPKAERRGEPVGNRGIGLPIVHMQCGQPGYPRAGAGKSGTFDILAGAIQRQ